MLYTSLNDGHHKLQKVKNRTWTAPRRISIDHVRPHPADQLIACLIQALYNSELYAVPRTNETWRKVDDTVPPRSWNENHTTLLCIQSESCIILPLLIILSLCLSLERTPTLTPMPAIIEGRTENTGAQGREGGEGRGAVHLLLMLGLCSRPGF